MSEPLEIETCQLSETAPATLDRASWSRVVALDVTRSCVSESLGGLGMGAVETSQVLERAGYECEDTGAVFAAAAHLLACTIPIQDFATDGTREFLVPRLASGAWVAGNAMTEPESGSHVATLNTSACRVGDGWLLNGLKSFVSNGPVADVLVTYACTSPGDGFLGNTAFAVTTDQPGVRRSRFTKMGLDGCEAGTVSFDDVFVPDSQVLGQPGAGGHIFQHSMLWERTCLFALYLGVMERQLRDCVDFVRSRKQGGKPIGSHQAVTHRLAEMQRRLHAARSLQRSAAASLDVGERDVALVSASKITVSEAALENALDALQIHGGAGYRRPGAMESAVRDAVPSRIFSGTNEIHYELIAKGLGL